jgi:hypothetical protein
MTEKRRRGYPAGPGAAFSVSARRTKSEVIKETEIPVSGYNPDAKGVASSSSVDHFKIPVQPGASGEPTPEEDAIQPLQNKVYSQMPRMLQSRGQDPASCRASFGTESLFFAFFVNMKTNPEVKWDDVVAVGRFWLAVHESMVELCW